MNCRYSEQDMALYAGGDLSGAKVREIEGHFAGCPACRVLLDELRESQEALHELRRETVSPAALAGTRSRVMAALAAESSSSAWRRRAEGWVYQGFRGAYALAGVAFVAAVCASVWYAARLPEQPQVLPVPMAPDETLMNLKSPGTGATAGNERLDPGAAFVKQIKVSRPAKSRHPAPASLLGEPREPVAGEEVPQTAIKLLTDDPNIVIYWLFDQKGGKL